MIKLIIPLLQLLVSESKTVRKIMLRIGISFFLLSIALAFMVIGLGFIIWALYLYLTNYLDPPISALASGLLILLLAGVMVFIARRLTRFRISSMANLSWVRLHPKQVTLVVLLAGFIAGSSSKTRDAFTDGLAWLLKRGQT